jgi:hypothetical protein
MNPSNSTSLITRVGVWFDLYLVDYAALSAWIGLAVGQFAAPVAARFYEVSAASVLALIVLGFAVFGGGLLLRMLQLPRPASPAYIYALSAMVHDEDHEDYDQLLAWALKHSRPLTRADAINAFRAARRQAKQACQSTRASIVCDAQRVVLGDLKGARR